MAATAPVKELGYANESYNWWLFDGETTPELIWPQSVFVYDQMRKTDSQVKSVLQAIMLPVRGTPWRIDPNGARDEVVELVADDLGLPIVGRNPDPLPRTRDRFSWKDHLRQALLMLPFGFMFFEQVYRIDPDGKRAHLRKLAPRMPRTIQRIDVAPDGGLIQISQYSSIAQQYPGQDQRSLEQQPIPVDRLVGYVNELEGGNWIGHSVLRSCYKNWLIKDRLLRVQAQTIERNGMGVPLYKAQDGASEADMTAGKAMAMAWRAGEAAGSAVPFGADMKLVGVEGTLPDADPAIRYHDEQIARGVLAHFLNLGTQTGSWALGSTFADFFVLSLQTLAQQIADTVTQHVIEDLVDINFGESEPAPRLVFDEIGSRQSATADALKSLVDAGILHPDQILEGAARQQYGLPPASPETAFPPAPTTPGGGGPPVTPEPGPGPSPEPPTTAPEFAMPPPGLQAGAGHPKEQAALAAKFNPDEPRLPDGKWGSGGGVVKDALKLADRIQLGEGERFVGSAKVGDGRGDYSTVMARVDGPDGPRIRFGVVDTHEGTKKWRGANGGATVVLDQHGVGELRRAIADAQVKGPKSVADYRVDIKARHGRGEPESEWPSPEADIAHGVIRGAAWGDIEWTLTREEGPDYIAGGVNLGPGGEWLLSLDVKASDNKLGPLDAFDIWGKPAVAQKLDSALADLMGSVAAAAGHDVTPGHDELRAKFNPLEPRDPHSGKWLGEGGGLEKLGHDLFTEIESANSADQVVAAMRRQKAANPGVSTEDLIRAADAAIAAKYPPEKYPQIDGFYSKMLAGRHAEIEKVTGRPQKRPRGVTPKKAPPPSDYPTLTANQAQAMQDSMPPPWTATERQGLRYYTGNSTVANGLLRGWIHPPGKTATDQKKIEAAQRNIEAAKAAMRPAAKAILVNRTTNPEQFGVASAKDLQNLVGHTMVERGFMSTTTKKNAGIGGKVRMEIEVPEGTPMAFAKSVSKYPYEDEVLLPPGLRYEILSVTGRTVRLRVVPA